jgi:hypothetical protein
MQKEKRLSYSDIIDDFQENTGKMRYVFYISREYLNIFTPHHFHSFSVRKGAGRRLSPRRFLSGEEAVFLNLLKTFKMLF